MKCPKCGKSLYKDNWYPMSARCMICGYWIERPTEAAMKFDRKLMVGTPVGTGHGRVLLEPCPVEGCNGSIRIDSTQPMCSRCRDKLRRWRDRGGKTEPPIIDDNGKLSLRHAQAA